MSKKDYRFNKPEKLKENLAYYREKRDSITRLAWVKKDTERWLENETVNGLYGYPARVIKVT